MITNNGIARGGIGMERKVDGKEGLLPWPSCFIPPFRVGLFIFYFFFKRSLQTFSGEVVRQTETEAPSTSFVFLSFIKEGFDSPQRQGVTLRHLDQTVCGTPLALCPQAAGGKAAGG
jgi:hypothetical protein